MAKIYYALLLSLFYLGACKTAGKAYDKGDYNNAIELAIKKLQKDPDDGETKTLLQNAYRFAVNKHQDNIRILSNSSSNLRFEQMYNEYRQLQNLYNKIGQTPSLASFVNLTDYSGYTETYGQKASDIYFEKGKMLMEGGEKEDFRNAYNTFKNALKYKSGDEAIRNKMEEAYHLAIVNIVVLPMEQYYGGGYSYTNSFPLRNFENSIIRNLRNGTNNEFIKLYSEWDARSSDIEPDEIIEMRLGRMEIGQPNDQTQSRTVSKDVVIKEIVYKPDSIVKQYAKVSAQINVTRRTLLSGGELHLTARDAKGRILWDDIFRGEHRWQVEFASYRGDERALSENDRLLLNNRTNYNTPHEDQIWEGVLRQIENEMNNRIRNHYNRYY